MFQNSICFSNANDQSINAPMLVLVHAANKQLEQLPNILCPSPHLSHLLLHLIGKPKNKKIKKRVVLLAVSNVLNNC